MVFSLCFLKRETPFVVHLFRPVTVAKWSFLCRCEKNSIFHILDTKRNNKLTKIRKTFDNLIFQFPPYLWHFSF